MKVLVGSKNRVKIEAAKEAFEEYFEGVETVGLPADSNVPDQPVNEDIYKGARNRVDNLIEYAKENNVDADYFAAIESGITNGLGKWMIINVAVIKDKNGFETYGSSAGFPVPEKYVDRIINEDLGTVMDDIFKEDDLRSKQGGIGLLTREKIDRKNLSKGAFIMALTEIINGEIWR